MVVTPPNPKLIAFVDGQNLYHAAREAFGYTWPNYDVLALARTISSQHGWPLQQVRFYTGVPSAGDDPFWHGFWANKTAAMGGQGLYVFCRELAYQNRIIKLPDGTTHSVLIGTEKGVDVRIAIDIVRLAHNRAYDVALLFSQDQDLSEVADEIRVIAREQDRWIKVASAYPTSPASQTKRGIERTDWIKIDRTTYDACLDPRDYRAKQIGI